MRNLSELFCEQFTCPDGSLRVDVVEVECAGLGFVRSTTLAWDWSGSEHYFVVRILNESKKGNDPDRVRRLGFLRSEATTTGRALISYLLTGVSTFWARAGSALAAIRRWSPSGVAGRPHKLEPVWPSSGQFHLVVQLRLG